MGWFKKATKSVSKAASSIAKETTNTVNVVAKETTNVANTVAKETVNTANTVAKETVNTANTVAKETTKAANTVAIETTNAANVIKNTTISAAGEVKVATTKSAMITAKVATEAMNEIEAGAVLAAKGMESGLEAVEDAGELIAEWVEENYCQIGVSIALGTIFAALLYRPEPSSQATTVAATAPLSSTAILYLSAKETVGAAALGTACDLTAQAFVELIWISADIRKAIGSKNKDLLTAAIAFTLSKSMDAAAGAMVIPQSCAAVVAGVVTTLVAQLACEQTLPSGSREWALAGSSGL
jgi:hypothetical protein